MFFRKKKEMQQPIKGDDGKLYVEVGEDYDENEYETDSDYEDDGESYDSEGSESVSGDESSVEENSEEEVNADAEDVVEGSKDVTATNDADGQNDGQNDAESTPTQPTLETQPEAEVSTTDIQNTIGSSNETSNESSSDSTQPDDISTSQQTQTDTENNHQSSEKGQVDAASLDEKRGLLALASEHDRVDILKSIVQPSTTTEKQNDALIQLLLNNRVYTNEDESPNSNQTEDIFVPPIHLAVASSSTNVVTCLLRMGANPCIRPSIPEGWTGPTWYDSTSNSSTSPTEKWSKFDGHSAWELAFGRVMIQSGSDSGYQAPNNPFNLEPSKVEALRHAFTAEILRSIGADEADRLRELLESGLDHQYVYKSGKSAPSTSVLDLGGKDIMEWCSDLKAYKCNEMLQDRYGLVGDDITAATTNSTDASADVQGQPDESIVQPASETVIADDVIISNNTISDLEQRLEENDSLSAALSKMLDNLAEEVSLTQGLILRSNGNGSNSALLSQVRMLKDTRADKEDELIEWESKLSDLITEWDMCVLWWKNKGWKEEDLPTLDYNSLGGKPQPKDIPFGEEAMKERIIELSAQLQLSTSKVQKLRSSISDLAEELKDNMAEVQKLGLTGAIQLSRTLKEEVRERDEALQQVKGREATYRAQVQMIRSRLETTRSGSSPAPLPMTKSQEEDTTFGNHSSDIISNEQELLADSNPLDDEVILTSETGEEDESESVSDGELDGSSDELPSQSVARGHSTAIIPRQEGGYKSYLSIDFWELFMRIIGLGRRAVNKTVKSAQKDTTYVMIV